MSAEVNHYAPIIAEKFDFSSADVYLLKYGVILVVEFDRFRRALQSGSLTNGDLIRQLLIRISDKPREFYRALRDCVNDNPEVVHPSNKELFHQLPENFVSV